MSTLVDLGPVRALVDERHLALADEVGAFVRARLLTLEHARSDDEGRAGQAGARAVA